MPSVTTRTCSSTAAIAAGPPLPKEGACRRILLTLSRIQQGGPPKEAARRLLRWRMAECLTLWQGVCARYE